MNAGKVEYRADGTARSQIKQSRKNKIQEEVNRREYQAQLKIKADQLREERAYSSIGSNIGLGGTDSPEAQKQEAKRMNSQKMMQRLSMFSTATFAASGVLNMLPDLKKALRNAVNLMEAPVDELADISLYSNQPKMRGLKLFLTEEMIKSLKIPLDIIDELNEKLFNRGITKDLIELILKQIEKLEKAIDFQYMFTHLYNIFGEHVDMSLRAKKLLMHEIFLIYEHPMAITDKDEEKHFRDYPESTNETIDMRKIRVIELLIPDLK